MWSQFLRDTLLKPLLERLGTAGAVLLLAGGDLLCEKVGACGLVSEDGARQTVTWVISAALVIFDLVVAWAQRRETVRKAERDLMQRVSQV